MDKTAKKEINRLKRLLLESGMSENRIKLIMPVIENTAWMKIKLDEAREVVRESSVVISYDNGGGQKGLRENPIFKGYESLWKSYMSGMNVILSSLPVEVVQKEVQKAEETKTMLELIREKHKKNA